MRVGIIGATGVLGREIVTGLAGDASDDDILGREPPSLFATGRTAGETIEWSADEELGVEPYVADSGRGLDVAIVATPTPTVAPILARLRELGVVAIDASRANRGQAPLYFEESPHPMRLVGSPLLALPSAESLALARLCVALGPTSIRATILKAAAGAGSAGLADLAEGTGRLLNGNEPETPLHGHRLAFNIVPQSGPFAGADSEAELDLARDLPAMIAKSVSIAATVGWGPWFYGDLFSLTLHFEQPISVDSARELLSKRPHIKVVDDPAESIYPMPSLATGDDAVLVGRLRRDPLNPNGLQLIAVQDGTRAAASHAIAALRAVARVRIAN